jgi:hypothetical protein
MESAPTIDVVSIFTFRKSSKSMSSSMEAKPKINVGNIFYKINQTDQTPAQADADRSGFEGLK